jgi:hypothetical protein
MAGKVLKPGGGYCRKDGQELRGKEFYKPWLVKYWSQVVFMAERIAIAI